MTSSFSLTSHLLSLHPDIYKQATQAPFLLAAAEGRLSKKTLGRWLANDRLYLHSYIRAAGKMIAELDLPITTSETEAPETQLVDWLIEALAGVTREDKLFTDVARRYGLDIQLEVHHPISDEVPSTDAVVVKEAAKLPGLVMIEGLFTEVGKPAEINVRDMKTPTVLPWLEAAVLFFGTEKCYLDAWSGAKDRQLVHDKEGPAHQDADGGALRKELIPNWSSDEFAEFVGKLGTIIDSAVAKMLERPGGEELKDSLLKRVEGQWKSLLTGEAAFWPEVE
jgi:thiaminase